MKAFATLVLLFGVTDARDPAREAMVNEINTLPGVLWKAGFMNFEELPLGASAALCGVLSNSEEELLAHAAPTNFGATAIPTDFDAVSHWPQCANVIGDIRDQNNCGCSSAFGTASAASDRICIYTNGSKQLRLPAEPACNDCAGGTLYTSWSHFLHRGNSRFLHFVSEVTHSRKWGFSGLITNYRTVAAIQTAIMSHGPVAAAFTVHADFENYQSGIYHHVTGRALGLHAVRLVGWGVTTSGTDYWKVANSWSSTWGEEGFFRITRGTNEAGIESQVIANGPNDKWSLT
jgi:cathepsin B